MKNVFLFLFFCSSFLGYTQEIKKQLLTKKELKNWYHKDIIKDTIPGTTLVDRFRDYENLKNPTTLNWLKNQSKISQSFLDSIPRIDTLIKYQQINNEILKSDLNHLKIYKKRTFYTKQDVESNHTSLYCIENKRSVKIFNTKEYNPEDNYIYSITDVQPSWDCSKIAICLSYKGRETSDLIVYDLKTKNYQQTNIRSVKPSIGGINWLPDNSGFLYTWVDPEKQNTNQNNLLSKVKIYNLNSHISTDYFSKYAVQEISIQNEDFPIIYIDHPEDNYLIGTVSSSSPYFDSYYKPIKNWKNPDILWKPLFNKSEKIKLYYQDQDSIVYLTSKNSPHFKICKTSIKNPDFENPKVIAKEKENEIIKSFVLTKQGIFYYTQTNGVISKLYKVSNGNEKEIKLPFSTGKINLFSFGSNDNYLSATLQGWLNKPMRYTFDVINQRLVEDASLSILFSNNEKTQLSKNLIIEEIEVTSWDGKKIPLSLIYNKETPRNGTTPVIMRAYGAYGAIMPPIFHYGFLLPALEGGIYAVAHVRGGGEKGENWYQGGFKSTKSNSWKDFISCSEYLIKNKYTSKKKIAIWSGSAGGIVIGKTFIERPDLYGACIIDNGILNPIRSENGVNGADLAKEFGSIKNSNEFKALLEMDSYHSIKEKEHYPAVLLRMGLNDSRVAPWQSIKFGAKLQLASSSNNPILIYPDFNSGHGVIGSFQIKKYTDIANAIAFAFWQTGHPEYQPKE
ncbi:prolyl oligopeptidase family serine peptidase [Aquimarina aquimarini]|uniref:prolyl oligopeptidase family serine peptidase n=1 Tax=Aquimarina aquimarini TaxID=1191734 RepID=UPI000D55DA00|nr:prolyl oligopeptidase family serine peptidase [Aquimarina aquimarini]